MDADQPESHDSHLTYALEDLLDDWSSLSSDQRIARFKALPLTEAQRFFFYLTDHDRTQLLLGLPRGDQQIWIRMLPPDDIAGVLRGCSREEVRSLMSLLEPFVRTEVAALLSYHEDSAGGLMSPQFLRVREAMNVGESLEYVRLQMRGTHVKLTRYAYVLNAEEVLVGVVSLRELLTSDPSKAVTGRMQTNPVTVFDTMSMEEIESVHRQYKLHGLPVVDAAGRMKGVLTVEELLERAHEEATEDIQRLGGAESLDAPYLQVNFMGMIKKRAGWLSILFMGEMLTATAMSYFEDEISKAVVLALFIPLIISSGGNSGSQASTLLVRAIGMGDVKLRDWWKVFIKEIGTGLALGLILGSIGFLRILLWPTRGDTYGEHYIRIALTVSCSLVGVVLWGSLSGSMLPFVLKKAGFDPATASAPFVATLVDVTGLIIYFSTAQLFLHGVLL